MAKGVAGTVFLTTDDVHADYEALKARGVEFIEAPEERPYGIDSGFRDPSGNQLPAHAGQGPRVDLSPSCACSVRRAPGTARCRPHRFRARTAVATSR